MYLPHSYNTIEFVQDLSGPIPEKKTPPIVKLLVQITPWTKTEVFQLSLLVAVSKLGLTREHFLSVHVRFTVS